MQNGHHWRNAATELQDQYKMSKKREEKETVNVEQFERIWEEGMHEHCDCPVLLSRRLQPVEVRRLTMSCFYIFLVVY